MPEYEIKVAVHRQSNRVWETTLKVTADNQADATKTAVAQAEQLVADVDFSQFSESVDYETEVLAVSPDASPVVDPKSVLFLRPKDLQLAYAHLSVDLVSLEHFGQEAQAAAARSAAVLYIDGVSYRMFKERTHKQRIKASYFSNSHSGDAYNVVDDTLFVPTTADALGWEAPNGQDGMVVCAAWTEYDSSRVDPDYEDDILGATVSHVDASGTWRKFHDRGVFIPNV